MPGDPSSGPYPVAAAETGTWSTADGEYVPVLARHPVLPAAGPALPVIVFCHGLGGSHHSYAALGEHLASHGYAVLHPQFRDSLPRVSAALGLTGAELNEDTWPRCARARDAMTAMLFDPVHWVNRVARVHSVIDSLGAQRYLPATLRPDGVIVAGHSFGAYTAQMTLGVRLYGVRSFSDGGISIDAGVRRDDYRHGRFAHPAAAAGVLLSPQGSGDRGLTRRSWDAITQPLLVVTGTRDLGPHGEGLAWRREPFDAAPGDFRHLAVVRDGTHLLGGITLVRAPGVTPDPGGLRDRAGERPPDPSVRNAIAAVTAAFANRVHGDLAADDWLASGPFPDIFEHEHKQGERAV